MTLIPRDKKTINTYLPTELLREIFLYNIRSEERRVGKECW